MAGVAGVALVAGWEFGRMMKAGGYTTTPFFTLVLIVLLLLNSYRSDLSLECILSIILLSSLTWQLFQAKSSSPTADWALTVIGGLYIGWGMASLVALRQLTDGVAWVWLVLLCTWGADTFAYWWAAAGDGINCGRVSAPRNPGKALLAVFWGVCWVR